jgi:hypothetical protein
VADAIPDRSDVVLDLLGERQGCPHQPGDALAERIVKPLDVLGLTRLLRDGLVLLGWDHAFVDFVLIRIEGGYSAPFGGVSRDHNDDMTLAGAVKAAVNYIVARDDLLILESHKKVKIITP